MSNVVIEIEGLVEIQKLLAEKAPKQALNLMRGTVQAMAVATAKEARRMAPKDSGTLRKAIKAKRRRARGGVPRSDVMVQHGNDAKHDAFYWRFVEFGTSPSESSSKRQFSTRAKPFIRPAKRWLARNHEHLLRTNFSKRFEKFLAKQGKR